MVFDKKKSRTAVLTKKRKSNEESRAFSEVDG